MLVRATYGAALLAGKQCNLCRRNADLLQGDPDTFQEIQCTVEREVPIVDPNMSWTGQGTLSGSCSKKGTSNDTFFHRGSSSWNYNLIVKWYFMMTILVISMISQVSYPILKFWTFWCPTVLACNSFVHDLNTKYLGTNFWKLNGIVSYSLVTVVYT